METDERVIPAASGKAVHSGTRRGAAPEPHHGGDPVEGHTVRSVDQSLSSLRHHVVEMGGLVIDQVSSAVSSLIDRDARLAELVLSREPMVNDYESRLDRDSLTFIALQQPVANDLRAARAIARASRALTRPAARSPLSTSRSAAPHPSGRARAKCAGSPPAAAGSHSCLYRRARVRSWSGPTTDPRHRP